MIEEKKIEILEPVLNEEGVPHWLTLEENDYKLRAQNLWTCGRCGRDIPSKFGKPSKCYESQGGCGAQYDLKQITSTIDEGLWELPIWSNLDNINMKNVYEKMLEVMKYLIVFQDDINYKIFTLWIISTWKLDNWDYVGFPAFIGIPDSGKTRALLIIAQLGYRALKTSGVTLAALPRLCHYNKVTLLIDEAHTKLNPNTEYGNELLGFIKDSYRRGSRYITCDNNDQSKVISTNNFGFKAFAGEKTFNPGLLSRCIVFWMEKEEPGLASLKDANAAFIWFRERLLYYRYKIGNPPALGNDFCLKGRTREIFESIIATGLHIGIDVDDVIKYAKLRDSEYSEELTNTVEYDVLKIIKTVKENPTNTLERVLTENILEELEWLSDEADKNKKAHQKLGYILKNMGIKTKRTNEGRAIFFNEIDNKNRLERLMRRYRLCEL